MNHCHLGMNIMRSHRATRARLRDLVLYVLIGVLAVLGTGLYVLHQAKTHGSPNLPLKWMGFGAMSILVFGYAIRANRANWGKSEFWGPLAVFAFVHFALGLTLVSRLATLPMILLGPLFLAEYLALAIFLAYFSSAQGKN